MAKITSELSVSSVFGNTERGYNVEIGDYINCCGIREISGLAGHRGPKSAMLSFCQIYPEKPGGQYGYPRDDSKFRYAVFSQAGSRGLYGQRFAAYILEQKLGEVIETGRHVNPNSGNQLKVFVWTVDHEAVKLWKAKVEGEDAKTTAKKASKKAESSGPVAPGR